ncbi:MAG TPA: LysE family transporter [Candidatus Acidoferrales bacterium]|nr:LysE family transporter [Candidatus Acidoferrales bacterium]
MILPLRPMNAEFHAVLMVVGLFFLGLVSPGPNFFVVIEATLRTGRTAGLLTGLGAATGDAMYACCGLFGVVPLLQTGGKTMKGIQLLGGFYLLWLGIRMLACRVTAHTYRHSAPRGGSMADYFWRGLLTDLSNPKTVIFFASIFAVAVHPAYSRMLRGAMLVAIVLTSIAWRSTVTAIFSCPIIRHRYQKAERIVECVFGVALCLFGVIFAARVVT